MVVVYISNNVVILIIIIIECFYRARLREVVGYACSKSVKSRCLGGEDGTIFNIETLDDRKVINYLGYKR